MWPDWPIYWTLSNFLKHLATINLPKSPTFSGNFWKGVKIYHFSSELIFGQLLSTFGHFFLVTLMVRCPVYYVQIFKIDVIFRDHDDETSVLEAAKKLNEVKCMRGLGRYFKQVNKYVLACLVLIVSSSMFVMSKTDRFAEIIPKRARLKSLWICISLLKYLKYCKTKYAFWGSRCGSVGVAVVADTKDPQFEYSHRKTLYYLYAVSCAEMTKMKKKGREWPFYVWPFCKITKTIVVKLMANLKLTISPLHPSFKLIMQIDIKKCTHAESKFN